MELFWRVGGPKRKNQKLTGVCLGVCFELNKIRIVVLNDGRDKTHQSWFIFTSLFQSHNICKKYWKKKKRKNIETGKCVSISL